MALWEQLDRFFSSRRDVLHALAPNDEAALERRHLEDMREYFWRLSRGSGVLELALEASDLHDGTAATVQVAEAAGGRVTGVAREEVILFEIEESGDESIVGVFDRDKEIVRLDARQGTLAGVSR